VGALVPLAACGLSLSGTGLAASGGGPAADASGDGAAASDPDAAGTISADSSLDAGISVAAPDGAEESSPPLPDASDGAATCFPRDAGLNGALDLTKFALVGNAAYGENGDARITLTNSENSQVGAAWYPSPFPGLAGYDLTFSFRVGPGDTAGDGITFAVLASGGGGVPGVGEGGDGLGLRNLASPFGGVVSGYAVDVDMYQNTTDTTDLGPTTLKLLTMPAFRVVAEILVPAAMNDGNVYSVDVSWRPPSVLTATLHGPGGTPVTVSSSDPGLVAPSPYLGFTAATGGISDSHNEIAGLTVTSTCAP
jgi:hypothetical protein